MLQRSKDDLYSALGWLLQTVEQDKDFGGNVAISVIQELINDAEESNLYPQDWYDNMKAIDEAYHAAH